MGFASIARSAQQFISNNSPAILTGIGVAGVITTGYLAAKAGYKSAEQIITTESELGERLEPKEKIKLTWKNFLPAMGVGASSAAAIIGSQRISSRRTATLASLYSLSERAFSEYKEKAVEVLGKHKAIQVQDEIANERIKNDPPSDHQILFAGGGETLCYEVFTGRYFFSDVEKLRKSQNDLNAQIINGMYASLNDWYCIIGLPQIDIGERVGWTTDNMLELGFSAVLRDEKPAIAIHYNHQPKEKYNKIF
jgi:hypothetical protein